MRKPDNGLRDRCVVPSLVALADERTVYLEAVDRQPQEIGEARIAGAEIVHRDLHVQLLHALEYGDGLLPALDQHALGELELEIAGFGPGRAQRALDGLDEARAAELLRGDVHREPERPEPGVRSEERRV